jgi:Holliday junction resolvase RusA-like endonuclease
MKIIIYGRIASKKNSKNTGRNKYTGKTFFTSSKPWKRFEKDALEQLLQYKKEKYPGLVKIDYVFVTKGKEALDIDNAMAGINDVLQTAGIIENDRNIKQASQIIIHGYHEWITEIEISLITERWNPLTEWLAGQSIFK